MDYFQYQNEHLYAEQVAVSDIVQQYGTPCYIYSRATLERHWHAFNDAFGEYPHLICYAVKANSNLAVLNLLARLGSGFDVVSGGELERVIAADCDPQRIVFSGVGKQPAEIARALQLGIYCFNVESIEELMRIQTISKNLNKRAPISLRINPDIQANTHPYISTGLKENKFGISIHLAAELYQQAQSLSHIDIIGVDCHIGSQITELSPFLAALDRLLLLIDELQKLNISIKHLDLGGGLGVRYNSEAPPLPNELTQAIKQRLALANRNLKIILEPGRAIAANAGILVTRVEYLKDNDVGKHFAIVDAGMNDLLRPALYEAWQEIIPVNNTVKTIENKLYDVVGPVCETSDFLGKDRLLALRADDLLAIRGAGAYGFSMSSNYNTRPRAAEVMVDGDRIHLIRPRETVAELFASERIIP